MQKKIRSFFGSLVFCVKMGYFDAKTKDSQDPSKAPKAQS